VVNNLIEVPLFDNNGVRNGIDLTAPVPNWNAVYVNAADASQRWFPIPAFENVELPKADSQFEEANSGRMAFLRQGKRSFAGELWADDSTPTFLGKLQTARCVDFGVYIVDVNGNLIGSKEGNMLYPIPVDNASWDPRFMFATDSTVQKIMLGFDFERNFDESTMYMITAAEGLIDFSTLKGLVDVNLTIASATATTIDLSAATDYGTAYTPIVYQGATNTTDWSVFNDTTLAAITVTAVTEGPAGTYQLSLGAGVTSGDDLTISVAKLGFIGEATATAV
jgi:hypothetical protein